MLLLKRLERFRGLAELFGFRQQVINRIDMIDGLRAELVEPLHSGRYLAPDLFKPLSGHHLVRRLSFLTHHSVIANPDSLQPFPTRTTGARHRRSIRSSSRQRGLRGRSARSLSMPASARVTGRSEIGSSADPISSMGASQAPSAFPPCSRRGGVRHASFRTAHRHLICRNSISMRFLRRSAVRLADLGSVWETWQPILAVARPSVRAAPRQTSCNCTAARF